MNEPSTIYGLEVVIDPDLQDFYGQIRALKGPLIVNVLVWKESEIRDRMLDALLHAKQLSPDFRSENHRFYLQPQTYGWLNYWFVTTYGTEPVKLTRAGLGVHWLWQRPEWDPLHPASCEHDRAYDYARAGRPPYPTSKPADDEFLRQCLRIADFHKSRWLRTRTYGYYALTRAWGPLMWKAAKD